jgi:F0F1-type ATP synthase delta subunit
MADEAAEELRQRLARSLERQRVVLERRVDAGILGGFVLRYDGMVADASLKTALDAIEARMLEPQLGSELIHEG